MPALFQKAIDLTLTNWNNTYAYLDDILIITEGLVEEHKEILEKNLRRLDEEKFAISLDKCNFACKQIEWLGFHIDCERTTPLSRKTDAIEKLLHPKRFSNLKVSWDQYTILQGTSHIWHIKKKDKKKHLICRRSTIPHFLKLKSWWQKSHKINILIKISTHELFARHLHTASARPSNKTQKRGR